MAGIGHNGGPPIYDTELVFDLTKPQYDFVNSNARFPALVAGYGSGKTQAGIMRAIKLKLEYPDQNVAYYLPTYDLINQIAFPRMAEILEEFQINYKINKQARVINLQDAGQIILRNMDKPERIIGYEVADSVCDELDTLNIQKAGDVWRKVVARNRQKKPDGTDNTVAVATTPEGFRFVYEKWQRLPMAGSEIIRASTYSNAHNLPDNYIQALLDTFPSNMLQAYLDGIFCNLTQGSVYGEYDRKLNACNTTVDCTEGAEETIHLGMDFNVGKMAAVVHVLRGGDPHAADEFTMYLDTPALIAAVKKRYPKNRVMVYPDASGKSRKSVNASESDIALLRAAGWTVCAHADNPFIKDRVAAVNKMIHKDGKRRYKVNVDRCPHLVEGLEKQAYDKNGEPDKTSGLDHVIDGTGYFIAYRYPVARNTAAEIKLKGL